MDRIYVMQLVRSFQVGELSRRTFLLRAGAALGSVAAANVLLAGCAPVSTLPRPVLGYFGAVDERLYRQMFSPVLWEKCVQRMADGGVELFIEAGPGKVLSNLVRRIVPGVPCVNAERFEEIESVRGLLA